jgi:hypothetical protein
MSTLTSEERLRNQLRAVQMTTIGMSQLLIYANERIEELERELAEMKTFAQGVKAEKSVERAA